jgi:hypothetical protein
MCTVSWIHQDGGYTLLCNRDEKRTRGIATSPQLHERGGVKYLAPVDAESGGTWIAVNEFGMSVCLLNGDQSRPALRSRGLLPGELIWQASVPDCVMTLHQMDLSIFAPFTVLILKPGSDATVALWDGANLAVDRNADARMPLVSSSFDTARVRRHREDSLAQLAILAGRLDPMALRDFHSSHGTGPDAYSPCMHRPDAHTVSFSCVTVTPEDIHFVYKPAAPCRQLPVKRVGLPRAA